jgi:invasion protein IalB
MRRLGSLIRTAIAAGLLAAVSGSARAVESGGIAPEQPLSFDRWTLSCSRTAEDEDEHCRIAILFPARANVGLLVITRSEGGWGMGFAIRPAEEGEVVVVDQARLAIDGEQPVEATYCAVLLCFFIQDELVERMRVGRKARLEIDWEEEAPIDVRLSLRNLPALLQAFEVRTARRGT